MEEIKKELEKRISNQISAKCLLSIIRPEENVEIIELYKHNGFGKNFLEIFIVMCNELGLTFIVKTDYVLQIYKG